MKPATEEEPLICPFMLAPLAILAVTVDAVLIVPEIGT